MNYPFWVNDFDRVKNFQKDYPGIGKIFEYPVAFWYGSRRGKQAERVDLSLQRLLKRAHPSLPVLVIYNLPNRDIGLHSKGGAQTKAEYLEFIDHFCAGIGNAAPIVIYEPDALPHVFQMDMTEAEDRLILMANAIERLTKTNALVYVDVGHSNWLSPSEAMTAMCAVANEKVRGFAVNVSNYRTTEESLRWADKVCNWLPEYKYVIDTSRNGNGPYGSYWCNPPGRALGLPPTCDTGNENCDAFLWIKIPGESDGKENGGPKAGKFWPTIAMELIENSSL